MMPLTAVLVVISTMRDFEREQLEMHNNSHIAEQLTACAVDVYVIVSNV